MKKFLSILLALAVGFTFTFGSAMSAFAAAPNTNELALLNQAYEYATTQVNNYYDKAYENAKKETIVTDVTISSSAWDAVDVKAGIAKDLEKAYNAQGKDYTGGDVTDYRVVANTIFFELVGPTTDTETALTNYIKTNYGAKAALNQYKTDMDEIAAALDNVDYSQYSETVDAADATKRTYLKEAQDVVAAEKASYATAMKKDGTYYFADTATIDDLNNATTGYKAKVAAYKNHLIGSSSVLTEIMIGTTGVGTGKYLVRGIKTKTIEENEAANDKAVAAAVKAKAQEIYTAKVAADPASKDVATAWVTAVNYLADANVINTTTMPSTVTDVTDVVAAVEALNTYAAKYKAEKDANGNLVRDAADVDAYVKGATVYAYCDEFSIAVPTAYEGTPYNSIEATKVAISNLTSEATAATWDFAKAKRVAELEKLKKAAAKNETYYPAELEKYNAAVDAAIEKVNAAVYGSTLSAITPDTTGILTAGDVDRSFEVAPLLSELTTEVKAIVNTINNVKNYNKTVLDPSYITVTTESAVKAKLIAYYGEKGVRTVAEMKAASAEDFIATLPTVGQIKDGKTAAETAIKAIPTKVTIADKATVEAAYKAAEEYAELMGWDDGYADSASDIKNKADLTAAIDALYTAVTKDMAVKAYQVNKNDKVALKALAEEYDAYNVDVTSGTIGSGIFTGKTALNDTAVTDALATIRTAEKNAVTAAVNAIPVNITVADKAKIEEARKLYDAYVAEYTDAAEDDNAALDFENGELKALKAAETTLAELLAATKLDDKAAKAYVQDLAIAVRTVKSGKKVKVTVNADVQTLIDNGFTVEYKFYKSTKKGSGYKNTVNKTTNTYTNTNPVKGKNYYKVKLVVKNADGTAVATTPLTQCKYGVRTIK